MAAMADMLICMSDDFTQRNLVVQVMHDFGADWQIRHDPETNIWTAVQYPTPAAQQVIVARSIAELGMKLEAAKVG
jgi:hypothetical protein